jgi:hypothetical protein
MSDPFPEDCTTEEIRQALLDALREQDRPSLERLAIMLEDTGGIEAARIVRGIAEGKPRFH